MALNRGVEEKWFDGLGGWRLVPLVLLIVIPLMIARQAASRLKAHTPLAELHGMAGHPLFIMLAGIVAILMLAVILLGLVCLVQFLRKKESFPRLIKVWLVLGIVLTVAVAVQYALDEELFNTVIDADLTPGAEKFWATLRILVFGLAYLYVENSTKVKAIFVH